MNDNLSAFPHHGTSGFWNPAVITDRDSKTSDVGNIEHYEFRSRLHISLVWEKGINLALSRDDLAFRIDDGCSVEYVLSNAFVDGSRDQPNVVRTGILLPPRFFLR